MRKFGKVSARQSFSPKYCMVVAENAIKPLVLYHEAMNMFLGSKNVLNLVYFWFKYVFWGVKCPKFSIAFGFPKIYCF